MDCNGQVICSKKYKHMGMVNIKCNIVVTSRESESGMGLERTKQIVSTTNVLFLKKKNSYMKQVCQKVSISKYSHSNSCFSECLKCFLKVPEKPLTMNSSENILFLDSHCH